MSNQSLFKHLELKSKVSLIRKRLEWHKNNGFFHTVFNPIRDYYSDIIKDDEYIEFMRAIGPIDVNNDTYLVLRVTRPALYKFPESWWRDAGDDTGEEVFDDSDSIGAKLKDIQLVACDSSLFFVGFDVTKNPTKLVFDNDTVRVNTNSFFYAVEELLMRHEKYCLIDVPDKLNL